MRREARQYQCYPIPTLSGMSTVPEALTAHQCGMAVFSFSIITNLCILSDDVEEGPTAEEVLEIGERRDGLYYDSNYDFDVRK